MLVLLKLSLRFLPKETARTAPLLLEMMSSSTRALRSKVSTNAGKEEVAVETLKGRKRMTLERAEEFSKVDIKNEKTDSKKVEREPGGKNPKTTKSSINKTFDKIPGKASRSQNKRNGGIPKIVITNASGEDSTPISPHTKELLKKSSDFVSPTKSRTRKSSPGALKSPKQKKKDGSSNEADLPKTSPQKRKQVQDVDKSAKLKKDMPDIEDVAWQPENWRTVLDNILEMRKLNVAPVDTWGCEECPEKDVKPEVFRYQSLISVMLSSQTRDEVTFAATRRLIDHGLTVDSILDTSDEKLGELIYPAGFWKSKVKYIKNTTQILKDQYNGDIPRTFKELCKLPGVGPKMANIVMSVGWKDTVGIAVDTHVHRISNRLGWVPKPTKDPEQTRKALEAWLPKSLWEDMSLHLVGFGQMICKPLKPKCDDCLNRNLCPSSS